MCKKRGYNLKEARTTLNEAKRNRNKKYRKECRVYRCPDKECNGAFHLTSKDEYHIKEEIPLKELFFKKEWEKLMGN